MTKLDSQLFWLAVNAYMEAQGESWDGQKAVCHVVLNRATNQRKSIKDIVLAPFQFSWANNGARPPIKNYEAFATCLEAAQEAIKERSAGYSLLGGDHYYAYQGLNAIPEPYWVKKGQMREVARIGNHIFFRS